MCTAVIDGGSLCSTMSSMSAVTRVVGYIRVSTDQQADGGVSLDAQRAKLRAYAEVYDLDLVGVVEDAGVSGKRLDRPGLDRALAMLTAGEADGLLVAKLDRLTRSVRDLGDLVERFFATERFALMSVAENVDTRSAAGRLVLNVLGAVSQWEREAIGERTRDALGHLRDQGVVLGGEALGWRRTDERDDAGRRVVENVATEAAGVSRILALKAEGMSVRAIAKRMEADGWTTKRGGRWHTTTVQRVLARARTASR